MINEKPIKKTALKVINNLLYLEFNDAIECAIGSENYLKKAKSIGSKSFTFIDDPADKRKVLIEYDTLKQIHKDKVIARFGEPYEHMAKQPIRNMVATDKKAFDFFFSYKYDENKNLPIDKVNAYTKAASWLNMLMHAEDNKKEIKKLLNLSMGQFWIKVGEIIQADKVELPATYKRLTEKIEEYRAEGYSLLIHKHFGNGNAKKVDCELSESLLLEICSSVRYKDNVMRARAYNTWAAQYDKKQITVDTVGKWLRKNNWQIMASREGSSEWYNIYGKQIMRSRPSAPLLLIGNDGVEIDLYFIRNDVNTKGHNATNYFHKKDVVVLMDAFNDYILGFAIGDAETADLIKLAYLNAVNHVRELTGNWYLPHQIQTDRFGNGALKEFYEAVATYTPARAKAPRGKYIERAFGTKWHQELALNINYAGNNVTAATKLNTENLQLVKKEFPHESEANVQINQFVTRMRLLIDEKTGITKQQQWLDTFMKSDMSQQKQIDDVQMLLLFGLRHKYQNTIDNRGITPDINCVKRSYEIPDKYYLQCVGKKMQVIYDPHDFSQILVTDNASLRFIAREYQKMPSAIADYVPGDRKRLNERLNEKKNHVEQIANNKAQRQELLQQERINVNALLQAGTQFLPKEQKQIVERAYHKTRNDDREFNPLDAM